MLTHPLVLKAIEVATAAHGTQKRKYTGVPYVEHCISVARRVAAVGGTPEQVASGVLHDIIEDTRMTMQELYGLFDKVVTSYVWWLTDAEIVKSPDGSLSLVQIMGPNGNMMRPNRDIRKAMNREKLAQAPDPVKTVKIADLIDNGEDITTHDPNFSVVFMREKGLLLPRLRGGDPVLWEEANQMLQLYRSSRTTP